MKITFFQITFYLSLIFSQNFNTQLTEGDSDYLVLSLNPNYSIISFSIEHDGCIDFIDYLNYPIMQYWDSEFIGNKINFEASNVNGNIYPIPSEIYTTVTSLLGNNINKNCINEITATTIDNQYLIAQWCEDFDEDQICDDLEITNITINSSTHPYQNLWYNSDSINYEISTQLALGYYSKLTTDSDYNLSLNDSFSTDWQGSVINLSDSIYYFHVIPMDFNYNFLTNKYKKFQFNINQNPVEINSITHPDANISYYNPNPFFVFQSKPGIDNYLWLIDREPNTIPNQDNSNFLFSSNLMVPGLDIGTHYLHLVGIDEMNQMSEPSHFQFNIVSQNIIFGCIDVDACNYDQEANFDDGSCLYQIDCFGNCGGNFVFDECGICNGNNISCLGCTDTEAINYDSDALVDDGSCEYTIILDFVGLNINDDGTGFINIDILNSINITGFQFDISGINIINASGGAAENSGFQLTSNETTVSGFSFTGNVIHSNANEYSMLTTLSFENGAGEVCMSNIMVAAEARSNGFIPSINVVTPSCEFIEQDVVLGCIDICANNFNPMANFDDGSCDYLSPDLNGDGDINILDTVRMIEIILNN